MKAGILSDTHDQRGGAEEALALFLREGVGVILHLDDVCQPETILAFRDCGIPLIGVFGNNDSDKDGLQAISGNAFHKGPHMPEIDGRRVLMAHAFDELQAEIGEGGKDDLILFGHTHRPLEVKMGRALILNTGEGCGFLSGKPTCAVVDLATMEASILEIRSSVADAGFPGGAALKPGKR